MTNPSDPCPWCGADSLESHHISTQDRRRAVLTVMACSSCDEFWVEGEGVPLTRDALTRLGLL